MRTHALMGAALLALLVAASVARADAEWGGTAGALVGFAQGDFRHAVDTGWGASGAVLFMPGSAPVALRLGASILIYGSETQQVPYLPSTGRVTLEETTDNWIGAAEVGPELLARHGAIRPYGHVLVGSSYFSTTTDLREENSVDTIATSTNFEDWAFRVVAGAGVRIALGGTGHVALDLGARYVWNSEVDYLTEGDIVDGPHGDIYFRPHRSRGDLIEVSVGLAWGGRR
jgi:hypothetical protein